MSINKSILITGGAGFIDTRQSARAVIPTIIMQGLNGSKELKLGNLEPTRDLTFAKDTCSSFLEIYKSELYHV